MFGYCLVPRDIDPRSTPDGSGAARQPAQIAAHAETGTTTDRYTLVKGCFALKKSLKKVATKISDDVWISRMGGRRAYVWIVDGGDVTHTGAVSQTAAQKLNKLAKRLVRVAST